MSIRVLAFTGIRSDYDLMSLLYKRINNDPDFQLGLIVSGAHLSETYGYTIKHIDEDNLPIIARIETLLDSNSNAARLKSLSLLLQNCIHTVEHFKPDIIIYAGDREDVVVGGLLGSYLQIPTIHFFGGDHASDGNVDNPIRHAVSKLSSLHFVTHSTHKERLFKMGENLERVFVVGSPAIDKFIQTPHLSKKELLLKLNRSEWDQFALVIYHPILGEEQMAGEYFKEILSALKSRGINAFISYPNVDSGNKEIIKVIEELKTDESFCFYKNLDRLTFINLMRHASFMIGNSSAGIFEAPSIPLGVVNVGSRQRGRLSGSNVIFVEQGLENINHGITKVLNESFKKELSYMESPFGNGRSVDMCIQLLKTLEFRRFLYKNEDPLSKEMML